MTDFHNISNFDSFMAWFLRSRMPFYDSTELNLPWWFGLSSWYYSVYGLSMIAFEPPWAKKSFFPYRSFAIVMIFLQGPLSFCADYLHMTNDSIFHILDRALATPACVIELSRLIAYYYNGIAFFWIFSQLVMVLSSLYCFMQSAKAHAALERDDFVFWHHLWHLYPLAATALLFALQYDERQVVSQIAIRRLPPKSVAG